VHDTLNTLSEKPGTNGLHYLCFLHEQPLYGSYLGKSKKKTKGNRREIIIAPSELSDEVKTAYCI
ncbi:hypothetical protein AKJ18_23465, partial [Vibrio xuii]